LKIKHYVSNSLYCFRTTLFVSNLSCMFERYFFVSNWPMFPNLKTGLFSHAFICFQWPIHVSNICFQYTWNLLIGGNILKHKKLWLDLLLVLVMFGGFHTCVTKMVVVPFLFLIYWCAFLVEFQESNLKKILKIQFLSKLDPSVNCSSNCILTGSTMKLNLEQSQLLIWFSIPVFPRDEIPIYSL